MLQTLLESLAKITLPEDCEVELRIVDNDSEGSGKPVIDAFRHSTRRFSGIRYTSEPAQNIALARNASINMGGADFFIFVDDDEWVCEEWLVELIQAAEDYKADAVFGPVYGICTPGTARWIVKGQFFDKLVPATGTDIDWKNTRTSNTLVRGTWFNGPNEFRFDAELGRSGGSDSDLFSRISAAGGKFVSCAEAEVYEHAPESRTSLRWLWGRAYRNGLIYERISSRRDDEISSTKRFFRRLGAAVILSSKGIPGVLSGDSSQFFRGLLKIPLAMGGLKAAMRPDATSKHVAYKGAKETTKVAFLTNIVSPYRKPVFERLSQTPNWDFTVYADAKREFDRQWEVDSNGLTIVHPKCLSWKRKVRSQKPVPFEQTITLHIPFGLLKNLFSDKPDIVISLELGLRTAIAAFYCRLARKRLIIWAYQSRISGTQGQSRLLWRKFLLRQAEKVVGMGIQAREVLRGWGVPDEKIVDALNAADHVTLRAKLSAPGAQEKVSQISLENAPNKKMAIVVGRLIPLKGVEYLLDLWKDLPNDILEEWQLIFIGDGPLSVLITEANCPSITWKGPVPSEEMAYWYKAADLHIFPTCGDVWGLVVNEASEVGTPSLCSIHAGCCDNLIHSEFDGLQFDPTQKKQASRELIDALDNPRLKTMGQAAKATIAPFSLDNLAESFRKATLTA